MALPFFLLLLHRSSLLLFFKEPATTAALYVCHSFSSLKMYSTTLSLSHFLFVRDHLQQMDVRHGDVLSLAALLFPTSSSTSPSIPNYTQPFLRLYPYLFTLLLAFSFIVTL